MIILFPLPQLFSDPFTALPVWFYPFCLYLKILQWSFQIHFEYAYMFLNIIYWVHAMYFLMYVFPEWSFNTEQPIIMLFPREELLLSSLLYSTAYCLLKLKPPGLWPLQFGMVFGVLLVQFTFAWSCWWDFTVIASSVKKQTQTHSLVPDPVALTVFLPPFL